MARAQLTSLTRSARVMRRPAHTWQVRTKPWQIQPVVLCPVLPGETMKNMTFQSRVITDPIRNPLTGWWCEYYFFYVKHRDMTDRDLFESMVLSSTFDPSQTTDYSAADVAMYKRANSIAWARHCLEVVVAEFFRNEGEAWNIATIGGVPVASVDDKYLLHSALLQSEMAVIDIDLTDAGSPFGADVHASEIDSAMRQWEFLRANNLTQLDYEQFLATYGVRPRVEDLHVPELLRYIREWSYPTNTVDPETGVPASAVSWAIAERADKDRFFREPGFIFGVSVVRPKAYRLGQRSTAADVLDNAFAWLPAIMQDDPATSLKVIPGNGGPFGGVLSADHVVDVRDLFMYGDQFINFDIDDRDDPADPTYGKNFVTLPESGSTVLRRYPDESDADSLFLDQDTEEPEYTATQLYVRQDGIAQISVLGMQVDSTPASGVQRLPIG